MKLCRRTTGHVRIPSKGCTKYAVPGKSCCQSCLDDMREYQARLRPIAIAKGLCSRCLRRKRVPNKSQCQFCIDYWERKKLARAGKRKKRKPRNTFASFVRRTRSDENDFGPRAHKRRGSTVAGRHRAGIGSVEFDGAFEFKPDGVEFTELLGEIGKALARRFYDLPTWPIIVPNVDSEFVRFAASLNIEVLTPEQTRA